MEKTEIIEEIKKYNHTVLNNEVIIQTIKEMKLLDRLEVLLFITDTISCSNKTDDKYFIELLREHFIDEFICLSKSSLLVYKPESYNGYTDKKVIEKAVELFR